MKQLTFFEQEEKSYWQITSLRVRQMVPFVNGAGINMPWGANISTLWPDHDYTDYLDTQSSLFTFCCLLFKRGTWGLLSYWPFLIIPLWNVQKSIKGACSVIGSVNVKATIRPTSLLLMPPFPLHCRKA